MSVGLQSLYYFAHVARRGKGSGGGGREQVHHITWFCVNGAVRFNVQRVRRLLHGDNVSSGGFDLLLFALCA